MYPLLAPGLLAMYVAAETASLTAERLTVWDAQLPASFHNYKVAFASDLHHGNFSGVRRMQKMVNKINAFDPDIIILGGDFLQSYLPIHKYPKFISSLGNELSKLQAPDGVLAVLGNHDHEVGAEKLTSTLKKNGVEMINNCGVWLERDDERIRIAGVGDMWYDKQNLASAKDGAKVDEFVLLVSHQPNFIDKLKKEDGINFMLAGHTHGGQLTLFNYLPSDFNDSHIFNWKYRAGMVKTEATKMLVSSGVGHSRPYIRFFAPPKIHLITFKRGIEV